MLGTSLLHIWELRALLHCAGGVGGGGFAGVIIPSWPGVLGKQKLLPCQRKGWLKAATGDEGWAILWASKRYILVFKFSPTVKFCSHEPFW